jgi:catechol 2,3-dioxygenase-like lactoylglutathione lyase family enzyme
MLGFGCYKSFCILYVAGSVSGFLLQRDRSLLRHADVSVLWSQPVDSRYDVTFHHSAIRTQNITRAISFYSMLLTENCNTEGTELTVKKFRAGPGRAAWLETNRGGEARPNNRIELIEVPGYMLSEGDDEGDETKVYRAPDLMRLYKLLGHNHIAFEVGVPIDEFLERLQAKSMERFGKTVRVALEPYEDFIDNKVYQLGFIYDADGSLVELVYKVSDREGLPPIEGTWEYWDGTGFRGADTANQG